jgi:hypothetical protein
MDNALAEGHTESDHRPLVNLVISTDRIDRGDHYQRERPANHRIPASSTRGRYLQAAIDKAAIAGDRGQRYRPHETPANSHITDDAGDAVGILAVVATEDRLPGHPQLPVSAMALQSRLEYRSSHYAGPRRPEGLTGKTTAQISLYAHRGQDKPHALLDRVFGLLGGMVY